MAYLTARDDFDAGIVISASHNPFQDNGIKVFSGHGEKFDEAQERAIEALIADASFVVTSTTPARGRARAIWSTPTSRTPRDAAVDRARSAACASPSTAPTAPRPRWRRGCFASSASTSSVIGDEPDGRNINLECGSTHPERLPALVRHERYRLGVAFDGDGDRAMLVDARGRVVDGDAVLLPVRQAHAAPAAGCAATPSSPPS